MRFVGFASPLWVGPMEGFWPKRNYIYIYIYIKWQNLKSDVVRSLEKRNREKVRVFRALIEDQRANFVRFSSNFIW